MTISGLDEVRYLPASIPPHRPQPGASAAQRLQMVEIALADQDNMVVDDRELYRSGPSYTFDTVISLQQELPDIEFNLIIGLDALLGFGSWYQWQDLMERVDIIAMTRPGWELPSPLPPWWRDAMDRRSGDTAKIELININPVDISATAIRQSILQGSNMESLLHPGVWQFIRSNNLYEQ